MFILLLEENMHDVRYRLVADDLFTLMLRQAPSDIAASVRGRAKDAMPCKVLGLWVGAVATTSDLRSLPASLAEVFASHRLTVSIPPPDGNRADLKHLDVFR